MLKDDDDRINIYPVAFAIRRNSQYMNRSMEIYKYKDKEM